MMQPSVKTLLTYLHRIGEWYSRGYINDLDTSQIRDLVVLAMHEVTRAEIEHPKTAEMLLALQDGWVKARDMAGLVFELGRIDVAASIELRAILFELEEMFRHSLESRVVVG